MVEVELVVFFYDQCLVNLCVQPVVQLFDTIETLSRKLAAFIVGLWLLHCCCEVIVYGTVFVSEVVSLLAGQDFFKLYPSVNFFYCLFAKMCLF